jgi:H+-translocating NAD(P) transhydrogenase subunit alpha
MSEGAESAAGEGSSDSVGVLRELGDEQRVALVPEDVAKLAALGFGILIEGSAGEAAFYADAAYEKAGAVVVTRQRCLADADLLLCVSRPSEADLASLRAGQVVVGVLAPLIDTDYLHRIAGRGVTAVSLDALPRTLSRAQSMDILSSQSSIAGYKAVLVAADHFGRYFPLLMTAAGTAPPAEVLVLGAGVAGLQAIATAHRLGAQVRGYDVRPEAREQVESLGGRFLELKSVAEGAGEGGYARALSDEETRAQQEELNGHIARQDVVITTAQIPGRRPPLLVTEEAVRAMRPGSVIVDMAASPLGGNVALSRPGETVRTGNGVTIIGAGDLASEMATGASAAFSHNVCALVTHLSNEGKISIDLSDEIQSAVVVAYQGAVRTIAPAQVAATAPETSQG